MSNNYSLVYSKTSELQITSWSIKSCSNNNNLYEK